MFDVRCSLVSISIKLAAFLASGAADTHLRGRSRYVAVKARNLNPPGSLYPQPKSLDLTA
jgi:hypothetical protein